jgi:hypothetical protein
MLAQNFKTAADLGISDAELDALIKVLGMLERGEITENHFHMARFWMECGTVGCLCGWANQISGGAAFPELNASTTEISLFFRMPDAARALFTMGMGSDSPERTGLNVFVQRRARPHHAATALRSYLTTGEANWAEALGAS